MDANTLATKLSGNATPLETAQWLRTEYMPALMARFNTDDVRKRLGLYAGDHVPDNERNLTDVRNRISLIVEYELARLSNQILIDAKISDLFWAYVVANRFPDLEVRKNDGSRKLRIEVKNLQSVAEEKSANFDTLKKDINPNTDYVIVFLWEWFFDGIPIQWIRAPRLLNCFVFHAMSLATLRDVYWLNQPPDDLGDGYQGFDIRYGINCKAGVYAQEEGNYGKLLRIWQKDFPYRPDSTPLLLDTENEYLRLKEESVSSGFVSLCKQHLQTLSQDDGKSKIQTIYDKTTPVGAKLGSFGFFLKRGNISSNARVGILMHEHKLKYGVAMTEKYVCTGLEASLTTPKVQVVFNDLKPKNLSRVQFGLK